MKQFIIATALLAAGNYAHACDMCGGGGGSQYIGLLPAFTRSFAGVQYNHNHLTGLFASPYKGRPAESTTDTYNTLQLWGRHSIGRYQIFAFVPWQHNTRTGDNGTNLKRSGIGDMTLLLNRIFIQTSEGTYRHTFFGGGGVKLPTGHYTPLSESGTSQSQSLSTGTGSWDMMLNANYTLQKGNSGINTDASALITTTSPDAYRYGSRLSAGVSVFHSWQVAGIRITPQAGSRYEYAMTDFFDYQKQYINDASGGNILYATAGVQATRKRIGLRASLLLPVHYSYADGTLTPNYKTETGLFFLF